MIKNSDPLRLYRKKNKLSQQDVADMLECSRQMVCLLELGERPYTAERAVAIEKKLGIPRSKFRPDLFSKAV